MITAPHPPTYAFQVIYIDLVTVAINEATQSYSGNTHILTVCDRLSRFCRFIPISILPSKTDKEKLRSCERRLDKAKKKKDHKEAVG